MSNRFPQSTEWSALTKIRKGRYRIDDSRIIVTRESGTKSPRYRSWILKEELGQGFGIKFDTRQDALDAVADWIAEAERLIDLVKDGTATGMVAAGHEVPGCASFIVLYIEEQIGKPWGGEYNWRHLYSGLTQAVHDRAEAAVEEA